jgi:hypothetical protein
MDATRFKKIFRLRQLDSQIKEIEQKMHKVALSIATTADVIEAAKEKLVLEKKETQVFLRKTPAMLAQSEQEISDKLIIFDKLESLYKVREKKVNEGKAKYKAQMLKQTKQEQ